MNQEKRSITVEDLLRLKRAERPAPEFWSEFDRELRTKQLAALLAKRPWWQNLSRVSDAFARLGHYRLPLGAAAALAITFFSVREYSGEVAPTNPGTTAPGIAKNAPAPSQVYVAAGQAPAMVRDSAPPAMYMSASDSQEPVNGLGNDLMPVHQEIVAAADSSDPSESHLAGQLSRLVPLLSGGDYLVAELEVSSDAVSPPRYITAQLDSPRVAETLGTGLLAVHSQQGFESRVLPSRNSTIDPLQQMTPPSEARRSRYRTTMVSLANEDSLDRTTARVAHRITGDELYEQVQRFGTRRGGINVRF